MKPSFDKHCSLVRHRLRVPFLDCLLLELRTWMELVDLRGGGKNPTSNHNIERADSSRWIFILEGILTVIVAFIAFFTLHDFPETATFLTEEERAFVVYRLKYQGHKSGDEVKVAQDDTFQWKYVKAAFLDWQIWTNIWVYWGKCNIL